MILQNAYLRITSFFLLLFFLLPLAALSAGEELARTPADYEGPFYPIVRQQDEDNDLIHVAGWTKDAQGDILHLSGKVVNTDGEPVSDAVVEIWQTDPNGLYKDKRDRSPGDRDPNFQYWGKTATEKDGTFAFITLVPGRYPSRPAHIHYKVWRAGQAVLTSQIYFTNYPEEKKENGSLTTNPLQTVELRKTPSGSYETFFRVVL